MSFQKSYLVSASHLPIGALSHHAGLYTGCGDLNLVLTPEKKILLPTEPPPKPSRVETFGTTTQGGSCYHPHPTVPQVLLALLIE